MGSGFPLFIKPRLEVSETYPSVIGLTRKISDIFLYLYSIILYHHILPFLKLWKIMHVDFELRGTQDMIYILFVAPCQPILLWCLIGLVLERGWKPAKCVPSMRYTIRCDAEMFFKSTHLLVLSSSSWSILHKSGLNHSFNRILK